MYSYRIEQAIRASAILHKDQVRKGSAPMPYVTHTFAVATIVSDYTENEDVFITALLHDTLEDTDYTEEELQEDFGGTVKDLVLSLTEPPGKEGQTWLQQKNQYIKQLEKAHPDALLVAAADKIHNMRSCVEEYHDQHERFLADFGDSLDERIRTYQEIHDVLDDRLKNDIMHEFNHVFQEYKNFIEEVRVTKDAL